MKAGYLSQLFANLREAILQISDPGERLACSMRAEQIIDQLVDDGSYAPAALAKHIRGAGVDGAETSRLDAEDARR